MNIFFDMDGTLISSQDESLRPGVRATFERLVQDGHRIYVWSGVGIRWAEVDRHSLRDLVSNCYVKPLRDHRASLRSHNVDVVPDFVIDDYREVVDALGGHTIRAYEGRDPEDREMDVVYAKIVEAARLVDGIGGTRHPSGG